MSTPLAVADALGRGGAVPFGVEFRASSPHWEPTVLPVSSASGDADEGRVWRHEGTVLVPDRSRLRRGMRASLRTSRVGSDGREYWAPLVTGQVARIEGAGLDGWKVRVCSDEWRVAQAGFPRARTIDGMAHEVIQGLIQEVFPDAVLYVDPDVRLVRLATVEYEPGRDSRWKAIEASALATGAVVYCGPGGGWVLAPPATVDNGPLAWEVAAGVALTGWSLLEDDEDFANVLTVRGEVPEGAPTGTPRPVGVASADVTSSSSVGDRSLEWVTGSPGVLGTEGRGVFTATLDLPVTTSDDARRAALAKLEAAPLDPRRLSVETTDNPYVTAGSRIAVVEADGRRSRHVVTRRQWTIPPTPMQLDTRR